MKILNITQHHTTPEQVIAGVVEPENKALFQRLLTFDALPTKEELVKRAKAIREAILAEGWAPGMSVLIGGAPYFMPYLEKELHAWELDALYAFSLRESFEEVQPDGQVKKVTKFRHVGFIPAELEYFYEMEE